MSNFTPQEIEQFLQEFFDVVGTRQYTGARYVPIFGRKGESTIGWDNSAPYEPLTIVLYRGSSYTSRCYVPKGIDILDTDYWVETGSYNAQVTLYRNEVLAVREQLDSIEDKIDYTDTILPSSSFAPNSTVLDKIESETNRVFAELNASKLSQPLNIGSAGQVLGIAEDMSVEWQDPVTPDATLTGNAVNEWLNDHPEATTTVLDGSVTTAKLADEAVSYDKLKENVKTPLMGINSFGGITKLNANYPLIQGYWGDCNTFDVLSTLVTTKTPILVKAGTVLRITANNKYIMLKRFYTNFAQIDVPKIRYESDTAYTSYSLLSDTDAIIVGIMPYDTYLCVSFCNDSAHTQPITPSDVVTKIYEIESSLIVSNATGYNIANMALRKYSIDPNTINADTYIDNTGTGLVQSGIKLLRYVLIPGNTYIIDGYDFDDENIPSFGLYIRNSIGFVNCRGIYANGGNYIITATETSATIALNVPDNDSQVRVRNLAPLTNTSYVSELLSGYLFAHCSMGKIYAYTRGEFKYYYNNTLYTIAPNTSFVFDGHIGDVDCLYLNQTGLNCARITNLNSNDFIIANCYVNSDYVNSFHKNVIANVLPLMPVYKRPNIPFIVNNKKLRGYSVRPSTTNYADSYGYFFNVKDRFNSQAFAMVNDVSNIPCDAGMIVRENTNDITGKKILFIGDSFPARGYMQHQINQRNSSVEFIGTMGTYYYNYQSEAYPGQSPTTVFVNPTLPTSGGSVTNPFYDPVLQRCTLEYYCRTQNVIPDYIIISFALNELSAVNYYNTMQDFIDTCYSYNANIPVYVVQVGTAEEELGSPDFLNSDRYDTQHKCVLNAQHLEHCVKIPAWYTLIDEFDYIPATLTYPYSNATIPSTADSVHPSEIGFNKLGDVIFNYLGVTSNAE